jgi:hypothetical protein
LFYCRAAIASSKSARVQWDIHGDQAKDNTQTTQPHTL